MLCICGGSGLVYVEPADVSLELRLGCESSARCPLFSAGQNLELVSWGLSTNRLLQSCAFFRSCGVVPGRSWREAQRDACASKLRTPWPSDPASASLWERGRDKRWWHKGVSGTLPLTSGTVSVSLFAGKVNHTAQARTQADSHTPVRVAMWRTRVCSRRLFDDHEILLVCCFVRFSSISRLDKMPVLVYAWEF